jgi:integrase/recombinase XerD
MASIKVILRKKINKEGKLPLSIQIIKDRKKSIIHLGQYINESDWDPLKQRVKKSHPNSRDLNTYILKRLTEANSKLLELETQKGSITSKSIKQGLKAASNSTFFAQAAIYLETLKESGKFNRFSADRPRVNRFKEFLKGDDISFQDITIPLLNRFKGYLKGTRQICDRTIINHLVVIRSIFSQAIRDNIVDPKYYPFGKDKIRIKFPDSMKISLSIEEVKKIEELELEKGSSIDHARNLWLISFYFAGMRVSDLLRLKWSDFYNERLHYAMGKNAKGGSLKIPDKAAKILSEYEQKKRNEDDLVFHHLKTAINPNDLFDIQKKISYAVKSLDESLVKVAERAKINKKLTMHIARHTFGNISGDKIPIQMLQKLYRHSSITTTIGYQSNFIHKDADDALDAVISF